jgi:hypothetical protein
VSVLEITNIAVHRAPAEHLHKASLDAPSPGTVSDVYSFDVQGSTVATSVPVERVEVLHEGRLILELPVTADRPDVPSAFAGLVAAEKNGFQGSVGVLSLRSRFDVHLRIRLADGMRLPWARIEGKRTTLPTRQGSVVQPLMITTVGRSGSTWLAWLLSCHPEVVAFKPFGHDVRVATYWTSVLQALCEPKTYLQQFHPPNLEEPYWWLGDGQQVRRSVTDPRVTAWLGRENIEALVAMCQSRIEAFYAQIAASEGIAPRYFVEKSFPNQVQADLLWEMYPGTRELILVRDFRDTLSSILAFNEKRGYPAFGREKTNGEADYVTSWLRPSARGLLRHWRRRLNSAHLVRYEDLVLEPAGTLTDLLRYLDLDSSETVVGEMLRRASEGASGTEGHRTIADPANSIGRWRRDLSPDLADICSEALGPVLADFGYSTEPPEHALSGEAADWERSQLGESSRQGASGGA